MIYPIKLLPYYRHGKDTPWGGDALRTLFSRDIPDTTTGESLECSAIDGMQSVIANGELKGKPLSFAFDEWGSGLTGVKYNQFPLLVKIIDAKGTLSVQVHPTNAYALENEHKLGKTECWVVLEAKPGAKIVCGLKKGDGDIESRLNFMDVEAGDVVYIPSGMVHALGRGIVVYELQQSSDVTYRLWDWGSDRPLHIKKAMDVINFNIEPEKVVGRIADKDQASVATYINSEFFSLSRAWLRGELALEPGKMSIITVLGDCEIRYDGGSVRLSIGETAIVPASVDSAKLFGSSSVLIGSTPKEEGKM